MPGETHGEGTNVGFFRDNSRTHGRTSRSVVEFVRVEFVGHYSGYWIEEG